MGHAADADRAQFVALQEVDAQQLPWLPLVRSRQRNADVAVEHAQLRVVARDHDGTARIPFAAPADHALRIQGLLHRAVEAGHAPVPLAHGAQQPEALEGLQHSDHPGAVRCLVGAGRIRPALQRLGIEGIAGKTAAPVHGQFGHGVHAAAMAFPQLGTCAGLRAGIEQGLGLHRLTGIHGVCQLADGAPEAPALAQHDGVLRQRWRTIAVGRRELRRQPLAGHAQCVVQRVGQVAPGLGIAAQVAQHGARLHRSQLVLVAQQHQAGAGRQCLQQRRHHLQVDHGGLIDDEHVHVQLPPCMESPVPRIGPRAQHGVQGARRTHALHQARQVDLAAHAALQLQQGPVDRLLQARGRLARGGGQGHAQLAGVGRRGKQQGQQPCGGIGLAGAGAARDHRQPAAQRQRAGQLLPVHGATVRHRREQPVQPAPGLGFVQRLSGHGLRRRALDDVGGHGAFVVPVAAQVQQRRGAVCAGQHQGLAEVLAAILSIYLLPVHHAHHGAGAQRRNPAGQARRQHLPQGLLRGQRIGRPGQHVVGVAGQRRQGQAAVAAPLHLRQQRGGHQQGGPGLRILPGDEGGQRRIQPAQQARVGPAAQQGQHFIGVWRHGARRFAAQRVAARPFIEQVQRGRIDGARTGARAHGSSSALARPGPSSSSSASSRGSSGAMACMPPAGPSMPRRK